MKQNTTLSVLKVIDLVIRHQIRLTKDLVPQTENTDLIWDLVMDVLRQYDRYEFVIAQYLKKPFKEKDQIVQRLMMTALSQMIRKPDKIYHLVNEAVTSCSAIQRRWSKDFVNATLRQIAQDITQLESKFGSNEQWRYAHPTIWIDTIRSQWPSHWQSIIQSNQSKPKLWLNLDCLPLSQQQAYSMHQTVPRASLLSSIVQPLPKRWYIQDIASQSLKLLLPAHVDGPILDACAAPGGKTLILSQYYPQHEVTAVDVSNHKIDKIKENITRLELNNVVIKKHEWGNDLSEHQSFGLIVVDAPCSASGTIKKHPEKKRFTLDLEALQQKQIRILESIWPHLSVGGVLIYSTCSIFQEENDQVIEQFITHHHHIQLETITLEHAEKTQYGIQILPSLEQDGHYYCRMIKTKI